MDDFGIQHLLEFGALIGILLHDDNFIAFPYKTRRHQCGRLPSAGN